MRERDAAQGEDSHGVVHPGVLPQSRRDAQGHPEQHRNSDAHEAQLQGYGQPFEELLPDAAAGDE